MIQIVKQRRARYLAFLLATLSLAASCAPIGTSSVKAAKAEAEEPEPVAITVFTKKAQLFMEYPRLVPGQEARFLAHITVLETGEPVRSGKVRLIMSQGPDELRTADAPRPTRDGLFIPVATFDKPGQYKARIVVKSDQLEESFPVGPLIVHSNMKTAFAAAALEVEDELPNLVPFLLETQWKVGLLMSQVERHSLTERLQVLGEVEAPHHAMSVASAPLAGRLLPPPDGDLPHLGDRVEKGQVIAMLEPPLTASDSAQLAANEAAQDALEMELSIREYDLETKAAENEQVLHSARSELQFARQTLARIEGLREKDLSTVADLEAAQRDVELADRARKAGVAMKQSLANAKQHIENLKARNSAVRSASQPTETFHHALIAPISGEIVQDDFVEGAFVESLESVFRILDFSRVWIAANVSEFDFAKIGEAPGALLKFDSFPNQTFDVVKDMDGRLINVGRAVDPETRTIELRYETANLGGKLRLGMFADVFIETEQVIDAIALPEEAIVMNNGRPVAFVLVHGEAFQKRTLELGIRDGGLVEVLDGIEAGERVVTKGAFLVKLASASPASFGEGHAH